MDDDLVRTHRPADTVEGIALGARSRELHAFDLLDVDYVEMVAICRCGRSEDSPIHRIRESER